ncbi:MAG TPA: phenylalanine--tRNA ligase subunit alpha [Candidatus Nitrosopolaris sp.]|nr:phenylalanine--tRNA ligase subunit alpha [Candidatus Nitrosopolaris sp.]
MTNSNIDSPLHPLEKSILEALFGHKRQSLEELAKDTRLGIDQIRRGIEWLKLKGLIRLDEMSSISLGSSGYQAIKQGLPERRLVDYLKNGKNLIQEISSSGFFSQKESHSAFRYAKQNNWIEQQRNSVGEKRLVRTLAADDHSAEEKLLKKLTTQENLKMSDLTPEEMKAFNSLKSRDPDYVREEKLPTEITITLLEQGKRALSSVAEAGSGPHHHTQDQVLDGRKVPTVIPTNPPPIDVQAPVRSLFPGRKHPIANLIDEVSEIFVGLGFTEIEGTVTQSSFWNFDALFTPQGHPAREMQDTFYLSKIKQDRFATEDQVYEISKAHKYGWKYEWNIDDARGIVLRTHTTAVTIKYLADNKPENARIFSIGRVFRNEKVSYKHLAEFTQIEGIVTGNNVSLQDLMGLQLQFYARLGIKNIKFWPTFFPYTEPSLQSMIYNEKLEKWVELFGMGVFRPQVTKALGIRNPVLAWGGGLERIAMLRFGLTDVRDLYENKLGWLRTIPRCQL